MTVVPASEATWAEIQAVFATPGDPRTCQCQWFKLTKSEWDATPVAVRAERLRQQTGCDRNDGPTSGLIAYVDGEPAGWCAVEPRTAYPRLAQMRVPWTGRDEDKDDPGVWSVTCFVTRKQFRRLGVAAVLLAEAVEVARRGGGRAVEGYPIDLDGAGETRLDDLYVGTTSLFAKAGFQRVSQPTSRRAVMRLDLCGLRSRP